MKKLFILIVLLATSHLVSAQWLTTGSDIYYNAGKVGIGTSAPVGKFHVVMGSTTDLVANGNFVDMGLKSTTGGWARAYRIVDSVGSDGTDGGAFGVRGSAKTPLCVYMAIPMSSDATGHSSTKIIALNNSGQVGIGTSTPTANLQVVGDARFGTNGTYTDLKLSTTTALSGYNQTNTISPITIPGSGIAATALYLKNATSVGTNRMDLLVDGNIGIGTTVLDANTKLTVAGNIHAKAIRVSATVPGPDYVFESTYKLTDLDKLKGFIEKYHHLPEIPSAAQMKKDGIDLGNMNLDLLKKVEELTLYLIDKDEQVIQLKEEIKAQEAKLGALEAILKKNGIK